MNQTASHMQTKPQKPQNQKHSNNRPKHFVSPELFSKLLSRILPLCGHAPERFSTLETEPLASWSDQSAKRTHPLGTDLLSLRSNCLPQLPETVSNGDDPSAELIAERSLDGFHRFTLSRRRNKPEREFMKVTMTDQPSEFCAGLLMSLVNVSAGIVRIR
jgi:hypothetical protein